MIWDIFKSGLWNIWERQNRMKWSQWIHSEVLLNESLTVVSEPKAISNTKTRILSDIELELGGRWDLQEIFLEVIEIC
jgi:hypothetical protein